MRYNYILILAIIVISNINCNNNSHAKYMKEYLSLYNDIIGQKIYLNGQDLLQFYPSDKKYPINNGKRIIGIIGSSCISCFEYIKQWNNFLKNNSLGDIKIIFVAIGEGNSELKYYLETENPFKIPLFLDKEGSFITKNKLFKYSRSFFLLNNDGEVLIVGNPVADKDVLEYYKILIK